MAKPKIKGKEDGVAHGEIPNGSIDYNNIAATLARLYLACDLSVTVAYTGDRLRQADMLCPRPEHT
jgi:hypothetical protein